MSILINTYAKPKKATEFLSGDDVDDDGAAGVLAS